MRLIKHHKDVITFDPDRLYPERKQDSYFKPRGLWVSDEDDYGWSHWCASEEFRCEDLRYEHLVELNWPNNILFIRSVEELDKFHEQFKTGIDGDRPGPNLLALMKQHEYRYRLDWLNWTNVYPHWQGIIITPYLWERRMDYMWYYGWDCASGCIWDLRAIRSFQPIFKQITWNGGLLEQNSKSS